MDELTLYIIILVAIIVVIGYYTWKKFLSKNNTLSLFRKESDQVEEIDEFQLIDKENDVPVISIKKVNESRFDNILLENIDKDFNPILSPILQQLPFFSKNVGDMLFTTYSLKINSSLLAGLNSGKLELMKSNQYQGLIRGSIIDSKTGKVVGQGNFKPTSGINPVSAALIVWQVMAVITAQKFLSDINKKLEKIQAGVDQLISFHKNEWWGKVIGNIKTLTKIVKALENSDTTGQEKQAYLNHIENIETEFQQLIEVTNKNMEYSKNELLKKDVSGTGLEEHTKDFMHYSNEILDYQKLHLSLHYGLMISNTMKFALPADKKNILVRNNDLKEQFSSQIVLHNDTIESTRSKIPQLYGSLFASQKDNDSKQAYVSDNIMKQVNEHKEIEKEISNSFNRVDLKAKALSKSTKVEDEYIIETDNQGKISSVKQIIVANELPI